MYNDINHILQRVIRPSTLSAQAGGGDRNGG
jgi:hypothetical protein